MGTSFEIAVDAPLPRRALWALRGTRRFMSALVARGALARMSGDAPRPARAAAGCRPFTRTYTYVPAEMAIPDVIKSVFNDTFLELNDACSWDDGLCDNDADHAAGTGDECLARADGANAGAVAGMDAQASVDADCPCVVANSRRRCYSQNFVITPGVLADLVTTTGDLALYPDAGGNQNSCRHVLSGTVTVGIPFLGGYVEEAVVENMRTFYAKYPAALTAVAADILPEFADGRPLDVLTPEEIIEASKRLRAAEALEDTAATCEPGATSADAMGLTSAVVAAPVGASGEARA